MFLQLTTIRTHIAASLVGLVVASSLWASNGTDGLPPAVLGIRVEDRVGEFLPLELQFTDDSGKPVVLKDYFGRDKVIVMSLNYSDCPGLCIAQLGNLVETLKQTGVKGLNESYEIVTVSIDPLESVDKAARTKEKYLKSLHDDRGAAGWHFLVGKQAEIDALAKSLGYFYTYDKINKRYNHPAVLYFVSSEGRLCRYLTDLGVEPSQFQLAINEASEGKLESSLADKFIQFCYMYDPEANRYSADARRILALGGAAFATLVFGSLAPFWFSKKSVGHAAKMPNDATDEDTSESDT